MAEKPDKSPMALEEFTTELREKLDTFSSIAKGLKDVLAVIKFGVWAVGGMLILVLSVAAWVFSTNQTLSASVSDRQAIHQELKDVEAWRSGHDKNEAKIITLLEEYGKMLQHQQAQIDDLERSRAKP
jgi:hypothetical protein